jgi:hypothetical protein
VQIEEIRVSRRIDTTTMTVDGPMGAPRPISVALQTTDRGATLLHYRLR